jgi:hypothetical protein
VSSRSECDGEMERAIRLVAVELGAEVAVVYPCEYGGCDEQTALIYRNGAWCSEHVWKMEWRLPWWRLPWLASWCWTWADEIPMS